MPIKTQVIPVMPLTPDAGELQNGGSLDTSGFFPFAGGVLIPESKSVVISASTVAAPKGAYTVSLGDYLYQMYLGTDNELYEINSLGGGSTWAVNEISQNASAPYTVDGTGWHFTQFGTHLVAVPGVSYNTTKAIYDTWTTLTSYVEGDEVNSVTITPRVNFICTTAGTSAGPEPTWDTTVGNTTADGATLVWTAQVSGDPSRIQWLGDATGTTGDAAHLDPSVMWPTGAFGGATKEFLDLIDYTDATIYHLKARFVAPLGRRLLLAHCLQENTVSAGVSAGPGYYPNRIHWSATDDPTTFVDEAINEANLSGFADLLDDWGPITGLSGGSDYALIFKSRGIYRMSWGGAFSYQFQPLPNGFGTRWSHSIVRVGNDVYFWGPSGPCVYVGSEGRVVELGLGRVSRSLLDSSWIALGGVPQLKKTASEWLVAAGHDSSNGVICWSVPSASATTFTQLLVYSYRDDVFSVMEERSTDGASYYLFDNPDTSDEFATLRDINVIGKDEGVFGVFVWSDTAAGGVLPSEDAVYSIGYLDIEPSKRTKINRIKPMVSLNSGQTVPPTITVTVNSRDRTYGTPTATTGTNAANLDKMGWITTPSCPYQQYHQIKIAISSTNRDRVAEFDGFQVEYEFGGRR